VKSAPAGTKAAKAARGAEPKLDETAPQLAATDAPKTSRRKAPPSETQPTLIALGQVVKATRKARGLTQLQLAQRCGFTPAAIFMVEGARQNMTIKNLIVLANALELDVRDLFPKDMPRPAAKLLATAETMTDLKKRVAAHLDLLDRLADDLREQAETLNQS
jgi:transcriptional regulator with XRE-family HTH domain